MGPRARLGVVESPTFSQNMSPSSSWPKSKQSKKPAEIGSKLGQHLLVSCFFYFSAMEMEAIFSSETSSSL
jgi:hypothetical protein